MTGVYRVLMELVTITEVLVLIKMVTTTSNNLTACRDVHWARPAV